MKNEGDVEASDADLSEVVASRIKAENELRVPTTNQTDNDRQIWLDTNNQELKARYGGTTYKTSLTSTAIPDSNIYLHDDWGDNKLQNRDNSGTTTHNGETGVYRPEWSSPSGFSLPSASNQKANIVNGEAMQANINLDFSSTITWELKNVDFSNSGTNTADQFFVHLFAEQSSTRDSADRLDKSYILFLRKSNGVSLQRIDTGSDNTSLISGPSDLTGTHNLTVVRNSGGSWELFVDGTSQGTSSDSTYTAESITDFTGRSGQNVDFCIDEYKVS